MVNWLDQQHYQETMAEIEAAGRGFDTEGVQAWLDYLREQVGVSDAPNVVACLYDFAKGVMSMIPYFSVNPDMLPTPYPHIFTPFTAMDHANVEETVRKQIAAGKRRDARREKVLA